MAPARQAYELTAQASIREISLTEDPLPLGPYVEDYIPAGLNGTLDAKTGITTYPYPNERVQEFSQIIQSLSALIVVTPQYNWSLPGELKNAFDRIFKEWEGMPMMAVNYGGRGGNKCAAALEQVFGGIHATIVSCGDVLIKLPSENIQSEVRLQGTEELFKEHEAVLTEKLGLVVEAAMSRRQEKLAAIAQA